MKGKVLFYIALSCLVSIPINGSYNKLLLDSNKNKDYSFFNKGYYAAYFYKTKDIIISPTQWSTQDWLKSSVILSSSSIAYLIEPSINNIIISKENTLIRSIGDVGNVIGHPFLLVPLTSISYTVAYYSNYPKLERASLLAIESLILSGVIVKGIKMTFQRHRPRETNSNSQFNGPGLSLSEKNQSFPSGHSALAWATATSFALEFKNNPVIKFSSYGLATFVAISRLFDNAHWASDAIIGSAIGHFIARYTAKNNLNSVSNSKLSFMPTISNDLKFAIRRSF